MEHFLGTVWWSALMFIAGAVIGPMLWAWATKFFPWSR